MTRLLLCIIAFTGLLTAAVSLVLFSPVLEQGMPGTGVSVYAQEDWKTEFEAICAGTQDPAALSSDELKKLIDRCDRLRPLLEKLDESQRKVYLKRLRMCRNLFSFIIESREKK